jgi:hypothetical protein
MTEKTNFEYQVCFVDNTENILGLIQISREDIMYCVPMSGQHICIDSRDYLVTETIKHYLLGTNTLVFNVEVREV